MNNGYGGPAPRAQGLGDREPPQHEPRARDQRGERVRGRRAGRALVRPLRRVAARAATSSWSRSRTSAGAASWATRSRTAPPTSRSGTTWRPQCGMEVVLAERRGAADRDGRDAGQPGLARVQARASARRSTQLFMQSNFGIVTKMGVWLMPYPECYMPLWLRVWNEDDLARGDRDAAHAACSTRTIENVPSDLQHDRVRLRAVRRDRTGTRARSRSPTRSSTRSRASSRSAAG